MCYNTNNMVIWYSNSTVPLFMKIPIDYSLVHVISVMYLINMAISGVCFTLIFYLITIWNAKVGSLITCSNSYSRNFFHLFSH